MKIRTRPIHLLSAAFATRALSAAVAATAQEDSKAAQQRPITNTAQPANGAAPQAASAPISNSSLAQTKFDLLDANHDGYVDKNEAAASSVLTSQFEKFDGNHDAKLSLTEFAAINDLAAIKVDRKGYQ